MKRELSQACEVVYDPAVPPSDLFSPVPDTVALFLSCGRAKLVSNLTAFVPDIPSWNVSPRALGVARLFLILQL